MGESVRRIGGYEVVDQLGIGAFGTVYRAKQVAMERLVALKILNPKYGGDSAYVARFVEEAKAAGRVNHANICQVYDVGSDKGLHYVAMELIDGPSLADLIRQRGRLTPSEAMDIARQITFALQGAQKYGLVHKDVKPSNILLTNAGVAKLVDLGLAKDLTNPGGADAGASISGQFGSASYMAPEMSSGGTVDIRSDIYALGATLYHALTGSPPFQGPHATAVMIKHASEPLTPPSDIDAGIPSGLSDVIVRMMAKSPDDRHIGPDELLQDLEGSAAITLAPGGGTDAAPRARGARAPKRRRPQAPPRAGSLPAGRGVAPGAAVGRRKVGRATKGGMVPLAVAGVGVVVAGIIIALVVSRGSTHSETHAKVNLKEAERLIDEGSFTSLQEASKLVGEVLESRAGVTSQDVREKAGRTRRRVERGFIDLQLGSLGNLLQQVTAGTAHASYAKRRIDEAERRYGGETTAPENREHASEALAALRRELEAIERTAKPAGVAPPRGVAATDTGAPPTSSGREPSRTGPRHVTSTDTTGTRAGRPPKTGSRPTGTPPGPSSGTSVADIVVGQVRDLIAAEEYAAAIEMIEMSMAAVSAVDKAVLDAAAKQVRQGAAQAFSELLKKASTQSRAGGRAQAVRTLEAAKKRFAFDQYASVIDAEIASLRAKAGN